jgi:hypothetical protein
MQTTLSNPQIGQPWPGQGGTFAGIERGKNGQPDQFLIRANVTRDEQGDWKALKAWAKGLTIEGHSDFTLADRTAGALVYANLREDIKSGWYWLDDEFSAGSAWCQDFHDGDQYYNDKHDEFLALAVRRLPISSSVLSTQTAEAAEVAA